MPSLLMKKWGLFDLANENMYSLDISPGLMKSLYCKFYCLCWGLLQLPQQNKEEGDWIMSNGDYCFPFLYTS